MVGRWSGDGPECGKCALKASCDAQESCWTNKETSRKWPARIEGHLGPFRLDKEPHLKGSKRSEEVVPKVPVGGKSTGVGLRLGVGPETTLAEALSPHDARKTQLRHVKTSRAAAAHDVNAGQCRANTHQHAIILYPSFPSYD